MKNSFSSNGKLLITGEYAVLDGATGLAVPTKYGQKMEVEPKEDNLIRWKSYDHLNRLWYEDNFDLNTLTGFKDVPESRMLTKIFKYMREEKTDLFDTGIEFNNFLNFPKNWGLGTSSTLINNIAQWSELDPYLLLEATFGGSGYDIAAAQSTDPILFRRNGAIIEVEKVTLNWPFQNSLFFVYLNQKRNSRNAITEYRKNKLSSKDIIHIDTISKELPDCSDLSEFQKLISEHERILASTLSISTIKDSLFSDFSGAIKSLGAWGGDFIMATGTETDKEYFRRKGYNTIVSFKEMIIPRN